MQYKRKQQKAMKRISILLIAVIILLSAAKAIYIYKSNSDKSAKWLSNPAPHGQLIDIGGRKLYASIKGRGRVTVIVESALAAVSSEWLVVQNILAEKAKVLVYDRAGYGWSDPGPFPRTSDSIIGDLTSLIEAMELRPPFVILGHDTGCIYGIEFTRRHPGSVIGLVLVDPFPLYYDRFKSEVGKAVYKNYIDRSSYFKIGGFFGTSGVIRWLKIIPYPDVPAELYTPIIENLSLEKTYATALSEYGKELKNTLIDIRKRELIIEKPLVLVTHSQAYYFRDMLFFGVPVDEAQKIESILEASYKKIETLHRAHSRISAKHSVRNIHLKEPDVIAEAVERIIGLE